MIATVDPLGAIVAIATDLTAALSSEERYERLLAALHRVIPVDASSLFRLEGDVLVPIVSKGLSPDAMGRRYRLKEQPRLVIICRSEGPVRFPSDSDLPDPFDGLLGTEGGFTHVHACLGCPLRIGDEIIGALTADAAKPGALDEIDLGFLAAVGALVAAGIPRGEPILFTSAHFGSDFSRMTSRVPCEAFAPEPGKSHIDIKEATLEFQRSLIRQALATHRENWSAAARSLGMHRSNFHHLAARLGLK